MPVHMIPVAWSIYDQFYPNRENGPLCWMYASQRERHFSSAATPPPNPFSLPTTYMELDWAVQVYTDNQSDLAVDKEREKGSHSLSVLVLVGIKKPASSNK